MSLADKNSELLIQNQLLENELQILKLENFDLTENLKVVKELLLKERQRNLQLYVNNENLILVNENLLRQIDCLNHNIQEIKGDIDQLKHGVSETNSLYKNKKYDYNVLNNSDLINQDLVLKNEHLQTIIENLKEDLTKQENLRRILHNTIQDLKGNIRVFCRIRPPNISKPCNDQLYIFNILNENYLEIRQAINARKSYQFYFDRIFPPQSTQEDIFKEISQLIQSALDGYNISILTYGQTGSGKTFTIQGTPENPGILTRTTKDIFDSVKNLEMSNWDYRIDVSFFEIYNENIYDLLDNTRNNCEICFNEIKGATIKALIIKSIKNVGELENLLQIANKNRKIATTAMNQNSSRSHMFTKFYLNGINSISKTKNHGTITLVDLAGSESAKFNVNNINNYHNNNNNNYNNSREMQRFSEMKNINKSLSALGNVILALFNNEQYIPYRNSKLTFLLQSSLGGNSKTLMFINISPFQECFMESLNTLRFATKVRQVKNSNKRHQI